MKSSWYYYDHRGNKNGPVDAATLKTLAETGALSPDSLIVNDSGKSAQARDIKGLKFPSATTNATGSQINSGKTNPPPLPEVNSSQGTENGLLATLVGQSGSTLRVYEHKIVIARGESFSNLVIHGVKGEKTIFYARLSAIQLKPPGMTTGYLQFSISGGNESTRGVFDAVSDENTIVFRESQTELARAIVEFIERKIAGLPTSGAQDALNSIQNNIAAQELLQKEQRDEKQGNQVRNSCLTGCALIIVLPFALLALLIFLAMLSG